MVPSGPGTQGPVKSLCSNYSYLYSFSIQYLIEEIEYCADMTLTVIDFKKCVLDKKNLSINFETSQMAKQRKE